MTPEQLREMPLWELVERYAASRESYLNHRELKIMERQFVQLVQVECILHERIDKLERGGKG